MHEDYGTFGPCHTDGNCCGPGSYCCAHNIPHVHIEECTCVVLDGFMGRITGYAGKVCPYHTAPPEIVRN